MATDLTARTAAPEELLGRLEELTARLSQIDDLAVRETAEQLVAAAIDLYGAGLERIVGALEAGGDQGARTLQTLAEDPIVASLFLIHGLYPVDLETRVREALETVRPYMESHGGGVEIVGLEDGVLRLRLQGSCNGCGASAATLELAIKQALDEAAPDLEGVEVEGVVEQRRSPGFSGDPLPLVGAPSGWTEIEIGSLPGDRLVSLDVGGSPLLVANVGGTLLAYENRCASCGGDLESGELEGGVLTCAACRRPFALTLAGRSLGAGEELQLAPVPLLEEDGRVKVALVR
jgi:Fe-S cluster biogenesis protein NfuA/nitrite reductase/ring-hydroxylating ferredoxin subunit